MNNELLILCSLAISVGFIHTLFGPDHYIPFIALGKARNWSKLKTSLIVIACGIGHVSSSIIIGFLGIAFGWTLSSVTSVESFRGDIAGWLLLAFGLMYLIYGIRYAFKNKHHEHVHYHPDAGLHLHEHNHMGEHSHVHKKEKKHTTQWVLFLIFIFGPCEPLIPLIMYPAVKHNYFAVITVSFIFAITTILTMLTITLLAMSGLKFVPFRKLEKYNHIFASIAILFCGIAIKFMGL